VIRKLFAKYEDHSFVSATFNALKNLRRYFHYFIDIALSPLTYFSAHLFHYYRKNSLNRFPISKKIFFKVGVLPIIDHYYEPLFNPKYLRYSLRQERPLPGINFNDSEQLEILSKFNYNDELENFPMDKTNNPHEYYYNGRMFLAGDAEYLYNIIRYFKPTTMIEIGSGNSTLMARNAINKNSSESSEYSCEHICIEPFEQPWLEDINIKVVREKVETIGTKVFQQLKENDILFIDSSHIIRPQGDVLFEYLELLPSLNKGVIIHIHDILSPRDYLDSYFGEYFWNEQYLLEAFLTNNKEFRIIGATNYLSHKYRDKFSAKCPIFAMKPDIEPSSFYMIKN